MLVTFAFFIIWYNAGIVSALGKGRAGGLGVFQALKDKPGGLVYCSRGFYILYYLYSVYLIVQGLVALIFSSACVAYVAQAWHSFAVRAHLLRLRH